MSPHPACTVVLDDSFALELPELAVPWQADTPPEPKLLVLNEQLAVDLDLDPGWLRSGDGLGLLVGTTLPAGAAPVAQAYAGHQFGGYVPVLGDGRALLLGELTDRQGRRRDRCRRLPHANQQPWLRLWDEALREIHVKDN